MRRRPPSRIQRLADAAQQEAQFTAEGSPPPGKVGMSQPEGSAAPTTEQGSAHRRRRLPSRTGVAQRCSKDSSPDEPAGKGD
jgi:hypothetical protein